MVTSVRGEEQAAALAQFLPAGAKVEVASSVRPDFVERLHVRSDPSLVPLPPKADLIRRTTRQQERYAIHAVFLTEQEHTGRQVAERRKRLVEDYTQPFCDWHVRVQP